MLAIHKKIILWAMLCIGMLWSNKILAKHAIKDSKVYYHQSITHLKRGRNLRAVQCLKKALALNPSNDAAHLLLIKIYIKSKKEQKAIPYLAQLHTIVPSSTYRAIEKGYLLGYNYVLQQDFPNAEKQLKQTIIEAYKYRQSNFHDILSRCYNALGYLNAIQHPAEEIKNQQILVLHKRTLFNSRMLFEEALRYNPQHKIAADNYNRVNTALHMPPDRITPFSENPNEAFNNLTINHPSAPVAPINPTLLPIGLELMSKWMNNCDELLLMLDISGSMRVNPQFNTENSKFNIMKNLVFHFLNTVDHKVNLGLLTVGGSCESEPIVKLSTSSPRRVLSNALQKVEAEGNTPLNHSLRHAPELFKSNNKKRAILFITDHTDGCLPDETCHLSMWLGTQNIALHVLTFLEEKDALLEYKTYNCMTQATNGHLNLLSPTGLIEQKDFNLQVEESLLLPIMQQRSIDESIASHFKKRSY